MIWWWICGFECEGFGYLSNNLMTAVKLSVSSRSLCVSKSATRSPCWWCASWWWWPWWAPSSWSTPSSSSSSRWPLRQVPHRRRKSHRAKHIRRHSQSCTPPGWTSWWWWSSWTKQWLWSEILIQNGERILFKMINPMIMERWEILMNSTPMIKDDRPVCSLLFTNMIGKINIEPLMIKDDRHLCAA